MKAKLSYFILTIALMISMSACIAPAQNASTYSVADRTVNSLPGTGGNGGTVSADSFVGTEARLLLGTRWMFQSTIEDIFGANTAVGGLTTKDYTRAFVVDQAVSWGGSCDPYANSLKIPHKNDHYVLFYIEHPHVKGCAEESLSQAAAFPTGSTSRFAWTIRTCDRMVSADTAIRYAATQAGYPAGSSLNNPPAQADIKNVFDLFYPGVTPSADVLSALQGVVDTANQQYPNSPEAWRYLFFTLCTSPGWQIL